MSHKKKIEFAFWIKERVRIVTHDDPEEPLFGVVTNISISENEIVYSVKSGINDIDCYAYELESREQNEED